MLEMKTIFAAVFLAVVLLAAQTSAFACSCGAKPTVLDEFEDSKLVIITKLVSVEKIGEKQGKYDVDHIKSSKMVVERVYKGAVKVGTELTFAQGGGADCIWTFDEDDIGREYLFYLGEPSKGHPFFNDADKTAAPMYYAITCGRSRGAGGATDDLLYLDKMDKVRGKTRISGELDSWRQSAPSFADIKIKIIGKDKTYETKTDKNGVYEIYDLPAGEYVIEPQTPKGWKINEYMLRHSPSLAHQYGESGLNAKNRIPITLEAKKHAALDLLFDIDNAISGRILSPVGKPMKGVCVMAVSTDLAEGDYRGHSSCTDEKGEFTIEELEPDNYILVINADGKMDGEEPFGTLFYPGVGDRKQAGVVAVDIGKFVNGVNIQIPKTEELIEIAGTFLYQNGKPVIDEWVEFRPFDDIAKSYDAARVKTDAQGRFTIKVVKGVRGKLWGEMYTYVGEFENCPALDKEIKKAGRDSATLKTDETEIEGNENLPDAKLTFPFPGCTKAKD